MTIDVTVIVPVYNPSKYIELCIGGYLAQTLPPERREIIFVDDGSTDETPARLDQLAAEHPDVKVIHQPNSGWPGKPRNVGIAAARGDYVFFCDHDDRLGARALAEMVAMARRTGADVLIPKMVSHGRRIPRAIFRTSLDRAVLGKDPLMSSLTPHKLIRRGFLEETGLRFPEGRRRLEDHVFVAEAFLRADVISVLADYPCYHRTRRDDGGNAAAQVWQADYYFRFVAEVIDVIEKFTEPGELRDTLLQRPYAGEMLSKLAGRKMFRWDPPARQQIFNEIRALALERFAPDYHHRLPIAQRAHAQSLIDDRLDRMTDLATRTASLTGRAVLHGITWTEHGWVADLEAELVHQDGSPIRVIPSGDGWSIDPRLIPADLAAGPYDLKAVKGGHADVVLRHASSDVEWYADAAVKLSLVKIDGDPDDARRVVFRGAATIDPATIAGGKALAAGRWNVGLRVGAFGVSRVMRPKGDAAGTVLAPGQLLLASGRVAAPRLNPKRQALVIRVAAPPRQKVVAALGRVRDLERTAAGKIVGTIVLGNNKEPWGGECRVVLSGADPQGLQPTGGLDQAAVAARLVAKLGPRNRPGRAGAGPDGRSQGWQKRRRLLRRRAKRQYRRLRRKLRPLRARLQPSAGRGKLG